MFRVFCYSFLAMALVGFIFSIAGIVQNRADTYWLAVSMCSALFNALLIFYWCFRLDAYEAEGRNA